MERLKTSYKYLRGGGCLAMFKVLKPEPIKIGPKTVECIFKVKQVILACIIFWYINQK